MVIASQSGHRLTGLMKTPADMAGSVACADYKSLILRIAIGRIARSTVNSVLTSTLALPALGKMPKPETLLLV